jgi:LPS-assembly lipoprotein
LSRFAAVGALTVLLSGCGFQLQGALTVPVALQKTYIATEDEYSVFYRRLREQLMANGIEVVDAPSELASTLSIHVDDTGQRVLSVSARNVPTEYEVYYSVEYSVARGTEILQSRQFINQTRDYTYDETLVLGKAREEQLMRDSLVDDLVRIVLKQLGSL